MCTDVMSSRWNSHNGIIVEHFGKQTIQHVIHHIHIEIEQLGSSICRNVVAHYMAGNTHGKHDNDLMLDN